MNKILVTGGCGFVGRHLIDKLIANPQNQIVCVDNLSSNGSHVRNWWLYNNRFTFYQADCLNFFQEEDEVYDEIYHLAAIVGGRSKIDYYPLEVAQDLAIDSLMFNWAYKHIDNAVYYFSSSAVYPVKFQMVGSMVKLKEEFVDFRNDSFFLPDQSYGWSKLTGEYLAHKFAKETGKQVIIFRPFSGFGEEQSLDYPVPSLAEKTVMAVKNSTYTVPVWGDGNQIRDFVYINDIIEIILAIRDCQLDSNPFVINIGSGYGMCFNEVIQYFGELLDKELTIEPLLSKPTGVFYRVADTTKQRLYNLNVSRISSFYGLYKVLKHYANKFGIRVRSWFYD